MTYRAVIICSLLLLVLSGSGCTSQTARQSSKQSSEQEVAQDSTSGAEARQGTSTVPIIIICNQLVAKDNHSNCMGSKSGEGIKDAINATMSRPATVLKENQK